MIKDLTLHNRDQQVIQAIKENKADLNAKAHTEKWQAPDTVDA